MAIFEDLAGKLSRRARAGVERFLRSADAVLAPLRRAGTEGTLPTDRERLRLSAAAAVGGLAAGWLAAGAVAGLAAGAAGGVLASRAVASRRERYARRLDLGAGAAATAIADALAAGRSPRGAIAAAAPALEGPIGLELARTARELELGASTHGALARLRGRARSRRIDMIAAAVTLQRRSGGDLAELMREIAAAADEQARLDADARAATAQSRFTFLVVLLMGPGGLMLAELAAPGTLERVLGSPVALAMVAPALGLQVAGAIAVHRLGRVRS
jgi:tight adherence protein B